MAAGNVEFSDAGTQLCTYCDRSVKGPLKCGGCEKFYHPACAVRIKGMQVTGFNSLMCPSCSVGQVVDTDSVRIINELLNKLVLELQDKNNILQENRELLMNKVLNLEERISIYQHKSRVVLEVKAPKHAVDVSDGDSGGHRTPNSGGGDRSDRIDKPVADVNVIRDSGNIGSQFHEPSELPMVAGKKYNVDESNFNVKSKRKHKQIHSNNNNNSVKKKDDSPQLLSKTLPNKGNKTFSGLNLEVENESTQSNDPVTVNDRGEVARGRKHNKSKQSKPIIGSGVNDGFLKGIPRMVHFHVTRLQPDTSEDMVVNHLRSIVSVVTCEKLSSKAPNVYSSFKISVPSKDIKSIMDPNSWPEGVRINKFFYRKAVAMRTA